MKREIIIILPYFGRFNSIFQFWLKGIENSKLIDFLIITDQNLSISSSNIKVLKVSFESLVDRIKQKFKFNIRLDNPYKLCDFRPAYGDVFFDECKGYKWFGWCDADMIFGDIDSFLLKVDNTNNNYDKILQHGHFTLCKNNDMMRKLYLKKEDDISEIEKVFSNPLTIGFDEDCWCQSGYKRGFLTLSKKYCNVYSDRIFVDIMPFRFNFKFWGSSKNEKNIIFIKGKDNKLYKISRIDDKIVTKEVMYVHLQKRLIEISERVNNLDPFMIIPPGKIVPMSNKYQIELEKLSPEGYRTWFCKNGNYTIYNIKERIKRKVTSILIND